MIDAGTKLGRYEIRSKLGAGGMAEVYLAHDNALDRKVALKILPADLAAKKDRMERFVREAKAAAALNHPNIAHIYEIGESEGVNFIAMEFVDGDTLRQLIHGKPTELKKLLRYLQHSAEALSKAHAKGIVHRDLKPDNIMVSREGHAKILDFGLAKLIEPQLADPSKAGNEEQITAIMQQHSTPGVVMGTIGYMSPEQARGDVKEIDHRSDIFSFGCILFEAATKQKPFMGDSMVKSLHKIIYEAAPPITDFNPNAPVDLQRIVRRCLAKDPDERYQTIKDVAIELKELRREIESGAVSAQAAAASSGGAATPMTTEPLSQPGSSSLEHSTRILPSAPSTDSLRATQAELSAGSIAEASRRSRTIMFAATALIGVLGLSFAIFMLWRGNRTQPFARIKATPITSSGRASSAAISLDGRYIVHVASDGGLQSLELRQVATNTNQQILAPAEASYGALTFSPDGNYLYYTMKDKANPSSSLFRKPVLGGEATRLTTNLFSGVSPSPDGQRYVFTRAYLAKNESSIIVANSDGSGEQTIAAHKIPDIFLDAAWSPDNKTVAAAMNSIKGAARGAIITMSASGGNERVLTTQSWYQVDRVRWLGDGSGLVVSAVDQSFGPHQLWYVAYPGGEARPITNDLNDYTSVSVTADGNSLVTVEREVTSSMWVAPIIGSLSAPAANTFPIDRDRSRQITSAGRKRDGFSGVAWTADGRITYTSAAAGTYDIWVMQSDGSGQKQLTTPGQGANYHTNGFQTISPDGRYIFFSSDRLTGSPHIWRMDVDGGNLKQLTNGQAENFGQVTADGQFVIYIDYATLAIAKVPIDGGQPTQLADRPNGRPSMSPDGKLIAYGYKADANASPQIALMPGTGGAPLKLLDVPLTADLLSLIWTPDSRAVVYVDTRGGISNLWSVPIDGGAPAQLTNFGADRMSCFDFSRDGKWLAVSRGNGSTDVVLFSNVK